MAPSDRVLRLLQSHRNCRSSGKDHPTREKVRYYLSEPLKRLLRTWLTTIYYSAAPKEGVAAE